MISEVINDNKSPRNCTQVGTAHNKNHELLICDAYKKNITCSNLDSECSTVTSTQKLPLEHYWDPSEPYILSCVSRINTKVRMV